MHRALFALLFLAQVFNAFSQSDIENIRVLRAAGEYSDLRPLCVDYLKEDPTSLEVMYYLALTYQIAGADVGAQKTDSLLLIMSQQSAQNTWTQQARALLASFLRRQGKYKESIDLCRSIISESNDSTAIFMAIRNSSISYRNLSSFDSAMAYAIKAEKFASLLQDDFRLHQALQNRANLANAMGEYENVLSLERELLSIAKRLGNNNLIITDEVNLGVSFQELGQIDSASYYYNRAIINAKKENDQRQVALTLYNLGDMLVNNNQPKDALKSLEECLTYSTPNNYNEITIRANYMIARAHYMLANYKPSEQTALQTFEQAKALEMKYDMYLNKALLSEIYTDIGQYEKAIDELKSAHEIEALILDESKVRAIEEMETRYETELKNEQIKNLSQETEIQSLQLRQQRVKLVLFVLAALLIITIIYFIYRQNTLKAQRNELLSKQKLLRAQINPHFFFNALTAIQNQLYTQKDIEQSSEYLSSFARLMRDTLESSMTEFVSVEEDAESMRNYLELQKNRNKEKFDFDIQIDEYLDSESTLIPPMLTQPFLENAVEHAFKKKEKTGLVTLQYSFAHPFLQIRILDDGSGIKEKEHQGHTSRAIEITKERITLHSKSKALKGSLSVTDRKEKDTSESGTEVVIKLPLVTD